MSVTGLPEQGLRPSSDPPAVEERFPRAGAVAAAVAGLAAGWLAAGSVGLLGHSYRRGLTWAALGCVLLASLPASGRLGRFVLAMLAAFVAAVPMIASDLRPVNVLGVVVVLVAAGQAFTGASRSVLRWSAEAVALLAVYRIADTSIGLLWLATDATGTALGGVVGELTRQPLWVGATFAGLDFLVVMLYLAVRATMARRSTAPGVTGAWVRCGIAVGAVLIGHLIYLNVLSCGPAIREHLPAESPPGTYWNPHPRPPGFEAAVRQWAYGDPAYQGERKFYEPAIRVVLGWAFALGQSLREWIPWNLPALAVIVHAIVAWLILRWLASFPWDSPGAAVPRRAAMRRWALVAAGLVLAALFPAVVTLSPHAPSLKGKKIVLYEKGFLNWEKPKIGKTSFSYGQYSIGMYGMLPIYLRSLGAEAIVSPELSESDLAGANVLVLIFPDKPWNEGQLERIRRFVEDGGTLLVLGEHTILKSDLLTLQDEELGTQLAALYEKLEKLDFKRRAGQSRAAVEEINRQEDELRGRFDDQEVLRRHLAARQRGPLSRFNEVLRDTDMEVRFDSATFAVGGWLQSYQAISHPTSAGLGDASNAFGAVIGASLDLRWPGAGRWPAQPLLIGLWGWADPGDPLNYPSFMARTDSGSRHEARYDPGERLGDLVLAAEQRIGAGRVVLFGDTSGFSNGVNMGAHRYTSRLFSYLADPTDSPQEPSRQVAGLVLALCLAAVLVLASSDLGLVLAAAVLAGSLAACTAATHEGWEVIPDGRGRPGTANNLAYVDESHLGDFSFESWRDDGLMGLCMNLMRNDYLTLMLPEFRRDRLLAPEADLGVKVEPVPVEAARQMKIEPGLGVVITEIEQGKAADIAGITPRSVVLTVNKEQVASAEEFLGAVDAVPPGQKIVLTILGREAYPVVLIKGSPRARLLISVAPGREYSASERETIRDFVSAGGIFVCTVGYPESGPSQKLLEEFGFHVGGRRWQWLDRRDGDKPLVYYKSGYGPANWENVFGEPKPLGYFKSPYFNGGDYLAFVRFYAAWPLDCEDPKQLLITYHPPDVPVIVLRRYEHGMVVVVADTAFAQNRNLENRDGSPFDGMRENAVFWRWLVALLRDGMHEGERWFPTKADTMPETGEETPAPKRPPQGVKGRQGTPPGKPGAPGAGTPPAAPKKPEGKSAALPADKARSK